MTAFVTNLAAEVTAVCASVELTESVEYSAFVLCLRRRASWAPSEFPSTGIVARRSAACSCLVDRIPSLSVHIESAARIPAWTAFEVATSVCPNSRAVLAAARKVSAFAVADAASEIVETRVEAGFDLGIKQPACQRSSLLHPMARTDSNSFEWGERCRDRGRGLVPVRQR